MEQDLSGGVLHLVPCQFVDGNVLGQNMFRAKARYSLAAGNGNRADENRRAREVSALSKGSITIKNGQLVTPFSIFPGTIVIENGIIAYAGSPENAPSGVEPVLDAEGAYITPGLIDIHVHGGGGGDVMDGTSGALEQWGKPSAAGYYSLSACHRDGRSPETLKAVKAVKEAAEKGTGGAEVWAFIWKVPI